jgi:hypothetical protein
MCDDDDDESCNKCYALFKQRDLRKMVRVFLWLKFFLDFLVKKLVGVKKWKHTRVVETQL